jgi:hypothetical protein
MSPLNYQNIVNVPSNDETILSKKKKQKLLKKNIKHKTKKKKSKGWKLKLKKKKNPLYKKKMKNFQFFFL